MSEQACALEGTVKITVLSGPLSSKMIDSKQTVWIDIGMILFWAA